MTSEGSAAPDLRTRILRASEALLERDGVGAMSMREVARSAGVSHQAPYHHFADRESILAALVEDGFVQLAARLRAAKDAQGLEPRDALVRAGEAYVEFAFERPGLFRVMFRPEMVDLHRFPQASCAGEQAFDELVQLVQRARPDATPVHTALAWSVVHGLASLIIDGPLGLKVEGAAERDVMMRDVVALFGRLVMLG